MHSMSAPVMNRLGLHAKEMSDNATEETIRQQLERLDGVLSRASMNCVEIERKLTGLSQGGGEACAPEGVPIEQSVAVLVRQISRMAEMLEALTNRVSASL